MITLLSAIALAQDVPLRPPPREPVAGECVWAVGVEPGRPLDPLVGACSAVLVPTSELAELHDLADHVLRLEGEIRALHLELATTRGALEVARQPLPLLQRPGVCEARGAVGALLAVGVGVAVVRAAEQ